jgi:DNA-binding Lrp family transcriptional regulator
MTKSTKGQIEQDEKKLLHELVKNSKESIDAIAQKCGFSRQKVWRMIKELEAKKLIWGYTTVFDEQKIGLKHFVFMARKTHKKIEEETVNTIISRELEVQAANLGITVESSFYVHGDYDWVLTATAENITQAKRFSDLLIAQYPGVFETITIMQTLIFVRKNYILNPERKLLKNYL